MKTVKLIIQKGKVKKDGTTTIFLKYHYSRNERKMFTSEKSIDPKFWNSNTQKVRKTHPQCEEINNFINSLKLKMEKIIEDAILKGISPTPHYVENLFLSKTPTKKKVPLKFFDLLEKYIQNKKDTVVNDVIKDYYSLKKHLDGFQSYRKKEITFDKIDLNFYDDLVHYLEFNVLKQNGEIGLQKSTVGKTIKNLKAFLNYSMRHKYITQIDLTGFKQITSKAIDIYISEKELDLMQKLDLRNNNDLEKIRDLFVIGCETGLRYSDLSRLSSDHIGIKTIKITTKKTLGHVIIPISKRLRKILEKYNNCPPSNIHKNFFNRKIKIIGKMAGINEYVNKIRVIGNRKIDNDKMKYHFISSHTCRRSFCTNQFMKGISTTLIRQISGHASEKAFLQYIKIDEEQAAEKMLEQWYEIDKKGPLKKIFIYFTDLFNKA